jgi:hypothetical protein
MKPVGRNRIGGSLDGNAKPDESVEAGPRICSNAALLDVRRPASPNIPGELAERAAELRVNLVSARSMPKNNNLAML